MGEVFKIATNCRMPTDRWEGLFLHTNLPKQQPEPPGHKPNIIGLCVPLIPTAQPLPPPVPLSGEGSCAVPRHLHPGVSG